MSIKLTSVAKKICKRLIRDNKLLLYKVIISQRNSATSVIFKESNLTGVECKGYLFGKIKIQNESVNNMMNVIYVCVLLVFKQINIWFRCIVCKWKVYFQFTKMKY